MMYLPAGYIVYGIPKKGVVVVDVSSTKSETINLFSQFSLATLTPSSL
jgi:uncharacterized protein (UPF0218 family)